MQSYEKQGFHSGTPPPFTGALSQSAGLAPSGAGYAPQVYIPTLPHSTMAMHQPLHQVSHIPYFTLFKIVENWCQSLSGPVAPTFFSAQMQNVKTRLN